MSFLSLNYWDQSSLLFPILLRVKAEVPIITLKLPKASPLATTPTSPLAPLSLTSLLQKHKSPVSLSSSGPLHLLFPLPGVLFFFQIFAWLTYSLHPGLCSNVILE